MPDSQLYTREAAVQKATDVITLLAVSKLLLFKSTLTPTVATTKAQLHDAECDFDGYTPGGYTLTAWTGPAAAVGGGAIEQSPLVNPTYGPASDPPVTNDVGGWWVEDAAGNVRLVGIYNPARPMAQVGDTFPILIQVLEAKNPNV